VITGPLPVNNSGLRHLDDGFDHLPKGLTSSLPDFTCEGGLIPGRLASVALQDLTSHQRLQMARGVDYFAEPGEPSAALCTRAMESLMRKS
jgi:hypothetical protein